MKKFLALLGTAAVVAAVTPYRVTREPEHDTLTAQALLWKAAVRPNDEGRHDVALAIGLRHPETAAMFSDAEPGEGDGYDVSIEIRRDDVPAEETEA